MSNFASLNITAGTDPLLGRPMTPVFYDAQNHPNLIEFGMGTGYQCPTESLRLANRVGWRWLSAHVKLELTVTPNLGLGYSDSEISTPGAPLIWPIEFDIGKQSTPQLDDSPRWPAPYDAPGPDLTMGTGYPINRTVDLIRDTPADPQDPDGHDVGFDPSSQLLASYSNLDVTSGLDSFFIYPIIRVSLGVHTFWTRGYTFGGVASGDLILYWMDNVEFTLTWGTLVSGPGIPIAPGPRPPTDGGTNVNPPSGMTTLFSPAQPYSAEYEWHIGDSLQAGGNFDAVKIRNFDIPIGNPLIDPSLTIISSDIVDLGVTAYYAPRRRL